MTEFSYFNYNLKTAKLSKICFTPTIFQKISMLTSKMGYTARLFNSIPDN